MTTRRDAQHDLPGSTLTRRRLLQTVSAGAVTGSTLSWLSPSRLIAADEQVEPLNRFPRMVHDFFVRQVRLNERRHLRALAQLKTKADAEAYVKSAQDRIRQSFGPEPERTPLNARVMKTVDRDPYTIARPRRIGAPADRSSISRAPPRSIYRRSIIVPPRSVETARGHRGAEGYVPPPRPARGR